MLRVSGGKYKNKKLFTELKGKKVDYRPSADRTRQAAFNILDNSSNFPDRFIHGAVVADLFCGCGSFGIEALSRGAKFVYFIDESYDQLELTKKNIATLGEEENATYIRSKAPKLPVAVEKCDLLYIDPPYYSAVVPNTVKNLHDNGWLSEKHVIIIELGSKEDCLLSDAFEIFDIREYGKTKLIFCCVRK